MMPVEPLSSYTWPTDGVPLAGLTVRVDDLATRLGMPVSAWHEDGLGPARGFGCRLPSGLVCLVQEEELSIRYGNAQGPTVFVDAADLGSLGAESLVAELLAEMGLSRSDLDGVAGRDDERYAAELAADAALATARRQASEGIPRPKQTEGHEPGTVT